MKTQVYSMEIKGTANDVTNWINEMGLAEDIVSIIQHNFVFTVFYIGQLEYYPESITQLTE